jgi:hypothetical protein
MQNLPRIDTDVGHPACLEQGQGSVGVLGEVHCALYPGAWVELSVVQIHAGRQGDGLVDAVVVEVVYFHKPLQLVLLESLAAEAIC